jgi:hypothetical protein
VRDGTKVSQISGNGTAEEQCEPDLGLWRGFVEPVRQFRRSRADLRQRPWFAEAEPFAILPATQASPWRLYARERFVERSLQARSPTTSSASTTASELEIGTK